MIRIPGVARIELVYLAIRHTTRNIWIWFYYTELFIGVFTHTKRQNTEPLDPVMKGTEYRTALHSDSCHRPTSFRCEVTSWRCV